MKVEESVKWIHPTPLLIQQQLFQLLLQLVHSKRIAIVKGVDDGAMRLMMKPSLARSEDGVKEIYEHLGQ